MPDLIGERGRHLSDLDVEHVFVVDLEDLRYQSGADSVGLAGVAIDFNPHRTPPSSVTFRPSYLNVPAQGGRLGIMTHVLPEHHRRAAEAARGFMPPSEGVALFATAAEYAAIGPILEVGTYCG